VHARSPMRLDDAQAVKGRRALVVEDGPTITDGYRHGDQVAARVIMNGFSVCAAKLDGGGAYRSPSGRRHQDQG
jgi:predicted GTPase